MSDQPRKCQEPECEAELPYSGRGQPKRWCPDHTRRAKQIAAQAARQAAKPPCCRGGVCVQHRQHGQWQRDTKASRYNSGATKSKNFRGRQVRNNGHTLPDTTATLVSRYRENVRPGLYQRLRREGRSVEDICRVLEMADAWAELEAQRIRWLFPNG